jgi:hypothetical protein
MENKQIRNRAWLMLSLRILLFAGIQGLFALGYVISGKANAWDKSANWWPFVVGFANLVTLALLVKFFKSEGSSFWNLFKINKSTIGKDLLILVGVFALTAPISYFPNVLLGKALFGDAEATLELFIRPLPMWAVYVSMVFFSVTQGLVEIPNYMFYSLPRLEKIGYSRWMATILAGVFLSAQHIAVPLLFNVSFLVWRLFMFLPFALFVAIIMRWRPSLLPYFAVGHVLMDAATAMMLIQFGY